MRRGIPAALIQIHCRYIGQMIIVHCHFMGKLFVISMIIN